MPQMHWLSLINVPYPGLFITPLRLINGINVYLISDRFQTFRIHQIFLSPTSLFRLLQSWH